MTTTLAQQIIDEVANEYRVDPCLVVSRHRTEFLVLMRVLVARRLSERKYSLNRIAKVLNRHHTTVLYYLGTGTRKCQINERKWKRRRRLNWHTPLVRDISPPPKRYLVPYAGAWYDDRYVKTERPPR